MAFRCVTCGKGPVAGKSYSHSHRASLRRFVPNLRRRRLVLDGRTRTALICARCIRSGKAVQPAARP